MSPARPRIAICSLYRYTHICEFADVAEQLNSGYDVRYFLGFSSPEAQKVLSDRGMDFDVIAADDAGRPPDGACQAVSARDLFQGYFLHYAEAVTGKLTRMLSDWRPTLVLCHLRDYAGMNAAEKLDLPVITFGSHTSPARDLELDPPFGSGLAADAPTTVRAFTRRLQARFDADVDAQHNTRIRRPLGLPPVKGTCTLHSPRSTLLSSIPALCNKRSPEPGYVRYIGRVFGPSRHRALESDEALFHRVSNAPRPRVLVSLGTTYVHRCLPRCMEALRNFPGTVVALTGSRHADHGLPDRTIVSPFVGDMDQLQSMVDTVITVAGAKSVLDALSHGIPLVCLPQQGEQLEIARMLASRGAALVPCRPRWDAGQLLDSTVKVSTRREFASSARTLQIELGNCCGLAGAVQHIQNEMETLRDAAPVRAYTNPGTASWTKRNQ